MPSWNDHYDPRPYAPHAPIKPGTDRRMTPLELATANGIVGCWISTGRPNTAAGRRVAAGASIQTDAELAIGPHQWLRGDHGCRDCPLPRRHRIHITAAATITDTELRILGERKESEAA
jgi:hypothetical protein